MKTTANSLAAGLLLFVLCAPFLAFLCGVGAQAVDKHRAQTENEHKAVLPKRPSTAELLIKLDRCMSTLEHELKNPKRTEMKKEYRK